MKPPDPLTKALLSPRLLTISAVLIVTLRFINLGFTELQAEDEAMYALRARAVVDFGAVLDQTPYAVQGLFISSYPPLAIWSTALFYKLFGIHEWSSRLFSALCGTATIGLVFILLSKLHAQPAAAFGAIVLGTNSFFTSYSQLGQLDVPYILFMSLATLGWFQWSSGSSRHLGLIFMAVSFGAALMTKIMVGFFIPMIIVLLQLASTGFQWRRLFPRELVICFLAGLTLALPWHLYMFVHHGKDFIDTFFWFHFFTRATLPIAGEGKSLGILFYFNQFFSRFPEAGLAMGALAVLLLARKREHQLSVGIPLAWFGAVFPALTIFQSKLYTYTLPLAVPTAFLAGIGLHFLIDENTPRRHVLLVAAATACGLLWAHAWPIRSFLKATLLGIPEINPYDPLNPLMYVILALAGSMPVVLTLVRRYEAAFRATSRIFVVLLLSTMTATVIRDVTIESPEKYNVGSRAVASLLQRQGFRELVLVSEQHNAAISFYLDGIQEKWYGDRRMRNILAGGNEEMVKEMLHLLDPEPARYVLFDVRDLRRMSDFDIRRVLPSQRYEQVLETKRYVLFQERNFTEGTARGPVRAQSRP